MQKISGGVTRLEALVGQVLAVLARDQRQRRADRTWRRSSSRRSSWPRQRSASGSVVVRRRRARGRCTVTADPLLIGQAMLNLAAQRRRGDARPAADGDGSLRAAAAKARTRSSSTWSVRDTGPGIPPRRAGQDLQPVLHDEGHGHGAGAGDRAPRSSRRTTGRSSRRNAEGGGARVRDPGVMARMSSDDERPGASRDGTNTRLSTTRK